MLDHITQENDQVYRLFDSASEAVMKLTLIVMETAPFGVFALMAWVLGDRGLSVLTVEGDKAPGSSVS